MRKRVRRIIAGRNYCGPQACYIGAAAISMGGEMPIAAQHRFLRISFSGPLPGPDAYQNGRCLILAFCGDKVLRSDVAALGNLRLDAFLIR